MKAMFKPSFILLIAILLMGSLTQTAVALSAQQNELIRVGGVVVDASGMIMTDLPAQVNIYGYSHTNTPESRTMERSLEIVNGHFETDLLPGVYSFSVRDSAEEQYFFNKISHFEIEENAQIDLVFTEAEADSILNIELYDFRSGEIIEDYGLELFMRSSEFSVTSSRLGINEPGESNQFDFPAGELELRASIFNSGFDYEIIDYLIEVNLVAGETVDSKLYFARNDSQFRGTVVDSEGNPLMVGMYLLGQGDLEGLRLHKFSESDGLFDFGLPAGTYLVEVDKYNMPDELAVPDPLLITVAPNSKLPPQTIQLDKLTSSLSGTITVKGLDQDDYVYMYEGFSGIGDPIDLISDGKDAVGAFEVPLADGDYLILFGRERLSLEFRGGLIDVKGKTEFHVETQKSDLSNDGLFPFWQEIGMSSHLPLMHELENGARASMAPNSVPFNYFREVAFVAWHASPLNRGLAPHGYTYLYTDSFIAIWDFRTPYSGVFQHPVQIVLPYDQELLKTGDPAELRVYKSYTNTFVAPDFVDAENQTVGFTIDRYSSFGLMMQGDETNQPKTIEFLAYLPLAR